MKYIKEYYTFIIEATVLNAETFKLLCKAKFGKLYDYSYVDFKGLDEPVRIICKTHGTPFNATPRAHLKGQGCPECKDIDLPNKIAKQVGYDTLTSPEHTHGRKHYANKPRTIPNTIRKN